MEDMELTENSENQKKAKRKVMVWDYAKDEALVKEILLFEPYQFKPRSRERGNAWKTVAENLCISNPLEFRVDARSVRERLMTIISRHKQKVRLELAASGISPENTPLDDAVEEISQKMDDYEKSHDNMTQQQATKSKEEAEKAQEVRQVALESLKETKRRKSETSEDEPNNKKGRRSSGSETLVFLREKAEKDKEVQLKQIELREKELELRKREIEAQSQQQRELLKQIQYQFLMIMMIKNNMNSS